MRGFGAATLTEQYQPPVQALCVINDPPPTAVTESVVDLGFVRTLAVEFYAVHDITSGLANDGTLASNKGSADSFFWLITGESHGGENETLTNFRQSFDGIAGNCYIKAEIAEGLHTIVFVTDSVGSEAFLDGTQVPIFITGTVDVTGNTYITVGARATTFSPTPVVDLETPHRVSRVRIDSGKYTLADAQLFDSGGYPGVGDSYEFPCTL